MSDGTPARPATARGGDPFVLVTLSLSLLCAVLLVAQRAGRADPTASAGRYELLEVARTTTASHPLLYHDTVEGRVWVTFNYRAPGPLLVSFEQVPAFAALKDDRRPEPKSDQEQLVVTVLHANSSMLRAWAADQLGLGPYPIDEVVDALIVALGDEDDQVVKGAALSLSRKPHPDAIPALREVLDHPDPEVVAHARKALAQLE